MEIEASIVNSREELLSLAKDLVYLIDATGQRAEGLRKLKTLCIKYRRMKKALEKDKSPAHEKAQGKKRGAKKLDLKFSRARQAILRRYLKLMYKRSGLSASQFEEVMKFGSKYRDTTRDEKKNEARREQFSGDALYAYLPNMRAKSRNTGTKQKNWLNTKKVGTKLKTKKPMPKQIGTKLIERCRRISIEKGWVKRGEFPDLWKAIKQSEEQYETHMRAAAEEEQAKDEAIVQEIRASFSKMNALFRKAIGPRRKELVLLLERLEKIEAKTYERNMELSEEDEVQLQTWQGIELLIS